MLWAEVDCMTLFRPIQRIRQCRAQSDDWKGVLDCMRESLRQDVKEEIKGVPSRLGVKTIEHTTTVSGVSSTTRVEFGYPPRKE